MIDVSCAFCYTEWQMNGKDVTTMKHTAMNRRHHTRRATPS